MGIFNVNAQSYDALWGKVVKAREEGLPVTEQMYLDKIVSKAERKHDFSQLFAAKLEMLKSKTSIEPDSFKAEVQGLEAIVRKCTNPVDRSVVCALLGSAFHELRYSWRFTFDKETLAEFRAKQEDYHSHILDDMEALSRAQAAQYMPLTVLGDHGKLFEHDMLAVMLRFVDENCSHTTLETKELHTKAAAIYAKQGKSEAEALTLMPVLTGDDLHALLMRNLNSSVGMDLACQYYQTSLATETDSLLWPFEPTNTWSNRESDRKDTQLKFIRWAKSNVKMGPAWDNLDREQKQIMQKKVSIENNSNLFAGVASKLSLNYNNTKSATIEIRKYNGRTDKKNDSVLRTDGELMKRFDLALGQNKANVDREAAKLPVRGVKDIEMTLPAGRYVVIAEAADARSVQEIHITSMRIVTMGIDQKQNSMYVVDAISGRPVSGAKVFGKNKNDAESLLGTTNAQGCITVSNKEAVSVMAQLSSDDQTDWVTLAWFRAAGNSGPAIFNFRAYTDRSIYRPGQTVKGNAMSYMRKKDDSEVIKDAKIKVTLSNPSRNKKQTLELVTNAFGTADFEFVLPEDAEVGNYNLIIEPNDGANENARHGEDRYVASIRVEEYKRPTFEVKFDDDSNKTQNYAIGEKINVKGKAVMFNGAPVQGGKVKCLMQCSTGSFWFWRQPQWIKMADVELVTDDDGSFVVPITLTDSLLTNADIYSTVYQYQVQATVTDQSGETHEGSWTVRVSKNEYALQVSDGKYIDIDTKPSIHVQAKNAMGENVDVDGTYTISGNKAKVIGEGNFKSNTDIVLPNLPFGNYTILVKTVDGKGNSIDAYHSFWAYHSKDKALDIHAIGTKDIAPKSDEEKISNGSDFFYSDSSEFSEDKPAVIHFAPNYDNTFIFYHVFSGDKLIDIAQAVVSNNQNTIAIPYRKEMGDGIYVHMFYVHEGSVFSMKSSFTYVEPDKKLTLAWSTFRDKLQPGQKEEWVLTVKDKNGKTVSGAEMMAVMYDAALDRILRHDWTFVHEYFRNIPYTYYNNNYNDHFPSISLKKVDSMPGHFMREFDKLPPYSHNQFLEKYESKKLYKTESLAIGAAPGLVMMSAAMPPAVMEDRAVMRSKAVLNEVAVSDADNSAAIDEQSFDNAELRTNFAETAFFMPHLVSDKKGDVRIAFQLPESLTEWRFLGFAHTADMNYGILRDNVVARKAFMVRPNMPRFVRWGDKASIVSSIINQSEEAIKGTVRMRMLNPESGEEVLVHSKPFAVEAGKTVSVDFQFDVLESYQGMDCEIIAVSGDTSDGEKSFLPVLSTKKLMVENVPFYLYDTDETTLDLSALFNQNSATATERHLNVEYTDNPSWMCIEALRSVTTPEYENAVSYAAAVNANARLVALIDSFPMLRDYEDQDLVRAHYAQSRDRLKTLQLADGGWSWFKGMKSSTYITLSVCEQLAMLPSRTSAEQDMLLKGLAFLDAKALESYNYDKKHKVKFYPDNHTLRYLYTSAKLPQRAVSKEVEKMRKEYLTALPKHINDFTIFGVANASCALRAFGYVKSADKFVNSLKEYNVAKPGLGRFYATDAAYYSWMDYRIPTQTAAMRALYAHDSSDPDLLDMQLWLISQKQTQKWDSPMNTIDVADLLLSISPSSTFRDAEMPVVSADGKRVENLHVGTLNDEREKLEGRKSHLDVQGNVIAEVNQQQTVEGVKSITVKRAAKEQKSVSWGFAQATYLEDLGNMNLYATGELSVDRKLYVYRNNDWVEVKDGEVLSVGDKVRMRQIVTADRDMDFVRLNAQHPACFEPISTLSGYHWLGSRYGYVSLHDTNTDVFFDVFTHGTTTIDLDFYVNRTGTYQMGVSTVECTYAKQFGGHTSGAKIVVK